MWKWLVPVLGLWAFQTVAMENDVDTHPSVYAGTYAVRFCRGSCPATTYRTGTLVLFDRPLRDAQGRVRSKWLERGAINGCLTLEPLQGLPSHWVFNPETASRRFLVWSLDPDGRSVSFEFDRSPDAGDMVDLHLTAQGLGGTGGPWGGADAEVAGPPPPRDQIQARRFGDADPTRCPRLDVDMDAMKDVLRP